MSDIVGHQLPDMHDTGVKRRNLKSRQQRILDLLFEHVSMSIESLAEHFGVSRMTIHRDAHNLADKGLIDKNHGSVSLKNRARTEKNVVYRQYRAAELKRAIIQQAVAMITPGDVIMLDDSTTVAEMLPLLPALAPLTVITNALGVIQALSPYTGITLICLGGEYNSARNAFFGLVCEQSTRALRANTFFVSTSIVADNTAFQNDQDVVKVKRKMMEIAERSILLADSTKFRSGGLHRFAELSQFDAILTDHQIDPKHLQEIRETGAAVTLC